MKSVFVGLVSTASAGFCCYEGCAKAPTSCNQAGDYCAGGKGACEGDCGGQWCEAPTPTPPAPTPGPPSPPSPTPAPASGDYCPSANDLVMAYSDGSGNNVQIKDQGYFVQGNGGVATKASFNLLGGYVEFDVDVSNVQVGVNANLYAIAPDLGDAGFYDNDNQYCDGAENERKNCIELDWLESNGNCAGATTLHTVMGEGQSAPCNSWGCRQEWDYNGNTQFKIRVEYDADGRQHHFKDGQEATNLNPSPIQQDWDIIKDQMINKGVVLYGSEWTGWVPADHCGGGGSLEGSSYTISNMVIKGTKVKGPDVTTCGTPPSPVPAPVPAPTPSSCPGGSLTACISACASDSYEACVNGCVANCPGTVV